MQFTRDEYRKIFCQVFPRGGLGEFEPGWERWRQAMAAQNIQAVLVLHDTASPPPAGPASDRYVFGVLWVDDVSGPRQRQDVFEVGGLLGAELRKGRAP
jgi:hypothetical protein